MARNIAEEQATFIKNMRWTVSLFKALSFLLLVGAVLQLVLASRTEAAPAAAFNFPETVFFSLLSYATSQAMGFLANLGERVERLNLYSIQQREMMMEK